MARSDTTDSTTDTVVDTTTTVAPAVTASVFQGFDTPTTTATEPVRPGRGNTLVRTPPGYAHNPGFDDLPQVTTAGVYVTAEQAERLIAESEAISALGAVYRDTTNQEGE